MFYLNNLHSIRHLFFSQFFSIRKEHNNELFLTLTFVISDICLQ